ncbi:MAG: histidine phosphatase family protein [Candidatus Synoicihabitans palmerolidicus]|nr:histidine phosphatase family protein [Candidatus Synoicihabitans palmerolidicus]
MRLCLIRHAHALRGENDTRRPLSERGRQTCAHVASFFRHNGRLRPGQLWHSPLTRATETAIGLATGLEADIPLVETDGITPLDNPMIMAQRLAMYPSSMTSLSSVMSLTSAPWPLCWSRVAPTPWPFISRKVPSCACAPPRTCIPAAPYLVGVSPGTSLQSFYPPTSASRASSATLRTRAPNSLVLQRSRRALPDAPSAPPDRDRATHSTSQPRLLPFRLPTPPNALLRQASHHSPRPPHTPSPAITTTLPPNNSWIQVWDGNGKSSATFTVIVLCTPAPTVETTFRSVFVLQKFA